MFINKRIISLAASLMLFCTCFISQVVAIADDENLNQNAPSIQVFSDDQISETLCSDEIDIEDLSHVWGSIHEPDPMLDILTQIKDAYKENPL